MKKILLALIMLMCNNAYAEEHDTVINTACEIHVFSMMRLKDEYKNVFPPDWSNKPLVEQEVSKYVKTILEKTNES